MTDIKTNAPGLDAPQQSTVSDPGIGGKPGVFKSAQVTVIDQNSLIADAAEELTSALSEETEKDVSEREVEEGRKADSLEQIMQVPEIQKMLKSLGDLDKKALHRALKALIQQQSKDPQVLRRQTGEQFKEPSHQYAALKMLVDALKARGASAEQIAAGEQALSGLMDEHGSAIRAALNIGETAQGFVKGNLGDLPDLRDAYTTNIHDYKSISAVLDDLVKRFGEEHLEKSINFMLKALASDLGSAGTSIDKTQLNLIMSDMTRLKTMATLLGNSAFLMRNARAMGAKSTFTPVSLLKQIAPLQDAPRVQKDQLSVIADRAGLTEIEHQIRFLNDLREIIRLVPLEAYPNPENREKLLDAINDALIEKGDIELDMEEDEEDFE
ncbi:MAG: YopN family type III secretion system gatekeeper subunit [Gammaproteobacteria bacterium]|nr:YopN family type III secretion system gatekeeper subunit [Gammaproteobacteria bacterium]